VKPNIRTYNAVIDSFAYNGRLEQAESMLLSMIENFESSSRRSMLDSIEDTELPVRPDSFSFNTVIQQWARSRTPEGGRRAERVLDRMLAFHHNGNADVRPDERSFAYIIYHYTKGAGRLEAKAPDRAMKLLRKMIKMYRQGYKELLPSHQNKTNPIFAFTSVIDAHSVLRRPDSGIVGDELFNAMLLLGRNIDALRPNTYALLSILYAWSSCGSVDAGERATELLMRMEHDMAEGVKRGEESRMRTTQRCYILAQTAWARSPSERKAEGALEVLEMMEKNFASGNKDARPTVQAYSMVSLATDLECAFYLVHPAVVEIIDFPSSRASI
jgi:pentatricopeptide repeat protein